MDWYPNAGETSLLRSRISFATGFADPVSGMRWFRDTQRRDIQVEVTGWPPGPRFEPHSKAEQTAARGARGLAKGIPFVIDVALHFLGSNGPLFGNKIEGGRGEPQDPADEVEDFPVMWAAPGTLARTLPWQLDPRRRSRQYRTDLVVTDQRLLILGNGPDVHAQAEVLWEAPADVVADAVAKPFSENHGDFQLVFEDGSWVRLSAGGPDRVGKFVGALTRRHHQADMSELTEAQRRKIAELVAAPPLEVAKSFGPVLPVTEPPRLVKLPSGILSVEIDVPLSRGPKQTLTFYLDAAGTPALPEPGDL
ncbi:MULTISPECIES: hypothetical protein [Streptomycetaceae]|uniref:Uncharacterized protein n=1 Tax=Streptantibioticus cattleyicolor (strain ATCC 35852 / DSM 46488 / JCM 4925 / NBRC 14057 / NRRL 8057) TaxID=1003195 RepID=F8K1K7_STREN|nr:MULTISPECIES: hypothetical protein [Streptomycetaceae]AEW94928.1 hypothetical protein SCATT_25570 [Streptantibioticus cattleyicolor NRRL 8057 = DSM 46488]MYS59533.1 hypothetical protein [Streptomyces sp. SID5468]CCB75278.1 protein of unknown function [Streptantibioticus cattleyicolor NRRL 8057 = DSM 46488]